jgi:hypothetical protein
MVAIRERVTRDGKRGYEAIPAQRIKYDITEIRNLGPKCGRTDFRATVSKVWNEDGTRRQTLDDCSRHEHLGNTQYAFSLLTKAKKRGAEDGDGRGSAQTKRRRREKESAAAQPEPEDRPRRTTASSGSEGATQDGGTNKAGTPGNKNLFRQTRAGHTRTSQRHQHGRLNR